MSHSQGNNRKYQCSPGDSLLCELPSGHALCLLFMGTCSRNFCRKAPIQDVTGRPAWWSMYKQSVTLPAQPKPLPCAGRLSDPSGKGCCLHHPAKKLLQGGSTASQLCLPRGPWVDFCQELRSRLYIAIYTRYKSDHVSWASLRLVGLHVVPRNNLLGLF